MGVSQEELKVELSICSFIEAYLWSLNPLQNRRLICDCTETHKQRCCDYKVELSDRIETHKLRCCDYRVVLSDRTEAHNKGGVIIG